MKRAKNRSRAKAKKIPYAAVALLRANGKTVSEISDRMGWTEPKNKFPYSYAYGILKQLRIGVPLEGLTVRINKKTQQPSNQRKTVLPQSGKLQCPLCGASSHRVSQPL